MIIVAAVVAFIVGAIVGAITGRCSRCGERYSTWITSGGY